MHIHDPQSYRYIFSPKHHEALAKVMALALHDTDSHYYTIHTLSLFVSMLILDNNRFSPTAFTKRVYEIVNELKSKENNAP